MAREGAISEYRNVVLTVSGPALPIDALRAVTNTIKEIEGRYAMLGATGQPDQTAVAIKRTGVLGFQVHNFTLTTVLATATYTFAYVSTTLDFS